MHICFYVFMYVCMYLFVLVCKCTYLYIPVCTCVYIYVSHTWVYIHTYMCVCACIRINVWKVFGTNVHACIYICKLCLICTQSRLSINPRTFFGANKSVDWFSQFTPMESGVGTGGRTNAARMELKITFRSSLSSFFWFLLEVSKHVCTAV